MVEFSRNESQSFESQDRSGDVLSDKEKLEQALQEKKDYIYSMYWNEEKGDQEQSKTQFELYLDGFNNTEKQNLIDALANADYTKLEDYIYENGYPINEETFSMFENTFGKINNSRVETKEESVETKEESVETKEESVETKEEEKQRYEKITKEYQNDFTQEIINQFDGDFKENLQILFEGKASAEEIEEATSFIDNELLNNQKTLTKLLSLIQKESPEKYESFKKYLISRDPEFEAKINRFEFDHSELFKTVTPLKSARNDALLQNTTEYNSMYVADLGDHIGLKLDPSKEPPETIITNGNYDLKVEAGVGVFYKPTLEYETKTREINKKIEGLNTQMTDIADKGKQVINIDLLHDKSGLDKLESSFVGDIEVSQTINQFKTENFDFETGELSLTEPNTKELKAKINSILEQRYNVVKEQYGKLQDEFKQVEKNYLKELDLRKKDYFDNIGKKQKEVMRFLHASGLDLIPQSIINQLIRELQSGLLNISGLNLNKQNIDLEKARFGESNTEVGSDGLGDQAKRNIVKFLEKLIYGKLSPENSIFKNIDPTKDFALLSTDVNQALEQSGVKSEFSFNIGLMRENLGKEVGEK